MVERWCRLSPRLPRNLGSQFLSSRPRSSSKAPLSRGAEAPSPKGVPSGANSSLLPCRSNLTPCSTGELPRTPSRNCLKSLGGTRNAGPQGAQTIPFGPFWPQYTGQISAWSVTRTPFQTVSMRSSTSEEAYSAQWGEKALARAPRSRTSATPGIQLPALKTLLHVSPGGMYQLGVDEDLLYLGLG